METNVTTAQEAQSRADVQSPPATALAELARLRRVDELVSQWAELSDACFPTVTSNELERGGVASTGQRVGELGPSMRSRSELRRVELQMRALARPGR